jgi:hypothetical protein
MNLGISRRFRCLGIVLTSSAWLGGGWSPLAAGEPILFTPAKSKLAPNAPNNKLPKEKVSALDRIAITSPVDAVDPANLARPTTDDPRRPKTREEKLRRLAELEKKNWATVGAGELQEEEEEKTSMGVREYDVETGGKEKTASDIWFDRKTGDKSRSQGNPRSRSAASRAPGQNRPPPRESDDEELKISVRSDYAAPPLGAPNPEDGRLGKFPDAMADGSKDSFGGANASLDQGRRGDSGLRTIEAPAGTRPAKLGAGEAFGFGRDTSPRSSLSGPSLLFDAPRSQPSSPFTSAGGSPGFGSSRNRDVPSAFDPPMASRDRFGNSASSFTPQQNQNQFAPTRDAFAPPVRPSSGR